MGTRSQVARFVFPVAAFSFFVPGSGSIAWAQLAAPNDAGVAMAPLHYHVRDVEANKRFWIALGGTPIVVGTTDVVKRPDVLVSVGNHDRADGGAECVLIDTPSRVRMTGTTGCGTC